MKKKEKKWSRNEIQEAAAQKVDAKLAELMSSIDYRTEEFFCRAMTAVLRDHLRIERDSFSSDREGMWRLDSRNSSKDPSPLEGLIRSKVDTLLPRLADALDSAEKKLTPSLMKKQAAWFAKAYEEALRDAMRSAVEVAVKARVRHDIIEMFPDFDEETISEIADVRVHVPY